MAVKYDGIERYIFADIYNFFLKYKDVPDEEYYWECLMQEARIINFKYKDHPMARSILVSTITQLEHVIAGKLREGLTHEQWEQKFDIAHKMGW